VSGSVLLVLGGTRSGKSQYAERRAFASGGPVLYVATGQALDDEMSERIAWHRTRRPPRWRTLEARLDLASAVDQQLQNEPIVLLDDLATFVSNVLLERGADREKLSQEVEALLRLSRARASQLIIVSAEVGLGVVPVSPLGRQFRDLLGLTNQQVAAAADEVVLVVAGLPLIVKPASQSGSSG
jgi:adenosylcobinamide kinase/adenosylcobinamide-phosphate guanylyltransferase